ncbi:MAG: cation diffusion facilitator family transporter [Desulfobacterales bacterium]|nr:cation diffusion facilitator family transporter [Desulfobacterales bacterium]
MNTSTHASEKERTALLSVILDMLLIIPSIVVALLANSMTLYADLLGDFNVFFANMMLWAILHKVRKGMGAHYDYGVGKMENMIGVIGALFVLLSIGFIMYTAGSRLFSPVRLETDKTLAGAVVMLIAMIVYSYLWIRNYRIHKAIPSPVTEIQWRVPMSNAMIAAGILVALSLMVIFQEYSWSYYIDPVVCLIMGGYIVSAFFKLIKDSLFDLLDRSLDESYQLVITQELAAFFDEYVQFHGLRSRRTGERVFIEIFLEFDPARLMGDVQQVVEAMRTSLEGKIKNSSVSISLAGGPVR